MVEHIIRCAHCRVQYIHQASGLGAGPYNHKDYCPDCWKVIVDALRPVPLKCKFIFVPQFDVTLEQVERWDQEWRDEHSGLLPLAREVFPSLYDRDTNEHSRYGIVRGRDEHKGSTFSYNYWPSKRSEAKVQLGVELNLVTGERKVSDRFYNPSTCGS